MRIVELSMDPGGSRSSEGLLRKMCCLATYSRVSWSKGPLLLTQKVYLGSVSQEKERWARLWFGAAVARAARAATRYGGDCMM